MSGRGDQVNVAMLANIGSQDIVALVKDLEVVHGEAVTRGMVMPSTEGPWAAVDVGKSVAYLDELSEQLKLTVAKDAPIDEGFFAPGAGPAWGDPSSGSSASSGCSSASGSTTGSFQGSSSPMPTARRARGQTPD